MPDQHLPIWYLQAGHVDSAGEFVAESQGSAVLVTARKHGEPRPRKMLLTAQHVLRSGTLPNGAPDQRNGAYHKEIRAWAPGTGFNDETAWRVEVNQDLMPDAASPLAEPEDLLFLDLPPDATGALPCRLLEDTDCKTGLGSLNIVGFISGSYLIQTHSGIVKAAEHPGWMFSGEDGVKAISILSPGQGAPGPGASGGGVFHGNQYAGVYRGLFGGTGQHLLLPVTRLREWCAGLGYELVNWSLTGAVEAVKVGLHGASGAMVANTPLKDKMTAGASLLRGIKDNLGLFNTYKQLHDCLHSAQLQLPGLEQAAKLLNTVAQAGDDLDLALSVFQQQTGSAHGFVAGMPASPPSLRSKEAAWLKKFDEAVDRCRQALDQGQSTNAQLAGKSLRTLIKVQHPRINGELRACAESMDMQGLTNLFGEVATLTGIPDETIARFRDGSSASAQIQQQLQALLTQHDNWQDIDTDLWNIEEELGGLDSTAADIIDALWNRVSDMIAPLLAQEPSAVWSANINGLQNKTTTSFAARQWDTLALDFRRFQRACRMRFFSVDTSLKETARETAELATSLNEILTKLAP